MVDRTRSSPTTVALPLSTASVDRWSATADQIPLRAATSSRAPASIAGRLSRA